MQKKYVAFLDILGFKDLVENNSHVDVVNLFDNFRIYVQRSLAKNKSKFDQHGRAVYDVSNSKINSIIISDSLIFWTNTDSPTDFLELIECIQSFLEFCHNTSKIFLRGAIVYGDFYYNNTGTIKGNQTIIMHPLIVGKALVDAHLVESKLQIAGCVIDKTAIDQMKKYANFSANWKKLTSQNKIIQYNINFKQGAKKEWTINWVRNFTEKGRSFGSDFASWKKSTSDLSVQEKIQNTYEYYKFVREKLFGMK